MTLADVGFPVEVFSFIATKIVELYIFPIFPF